MKSKILNHSALQWILLAILSVIWGSSFILIKRGLDAFSPGQVGTIRIFFASLVMIPFAVKYIKPLFIDNWKKILALGLIGNFIPAILFAMAETGLSSSLTGILNSLTPIFTLIVGMVVFGLGLNKKQAVGLIIGLSGSVLITFINNGGGLGEFNYYALFVIIATICYGINVNMLKTFFPDANPRVLTALIMMSIGPFAVIYLFSTDFISVVIHHKDAWPSLGYLFLLGAVGTAFAIALFNKLIQLTTAVFAASVTYLIPIVAVMWGILDGEAFTVYHLLGMILTIFGVYIVNKYK